MPIKLVEKRGTTIIMVAGVDEAGRGPLAGPVTAGCVVLPEGFADERICDSKQLTHEERVECYKLISKKALSWAVVSVGHRRVEALNILQATRLAMSLCTIRARRLLARKLKLSDDRVALHLKIDGNTRIETPFAQETIIDGDALVPCISAASIMAKVTRDRLMETLGRRYPLYGFERHKGYATREHLHAVSLHGPCPVHRRTFRGVAEHCKGNEVPFVQESSLEECSLRHSAFEISLEPGLMEGARDPESSGELHSAIS